MSRCYKKCVWCSQITLLLIWIHSSKRVLLNGQKFNSFEKKNLKSAKLLNIPIWFRCNYVCFSVLRNNMLVIKFPISKKCWIYRFEQHKRKWTLNEKLLHNDYEHFSVKFILCDKTIKSRWFIFYDSLWGHIFWSKSTTHSYFQSYLHSCG